MPSTTPEIQPNQPRSMPVPRINTMPEKFYIKDSGGKGGKNIVIIVLGVVLVIALLGGGAYLYIQKNSQPADNNNALVINDNANQAANNAVNNDNVNTANKNTNITNAKTNSTTNLNPANLNIFLNANSNTNAPANVNTTVVPSSQDTDSDSLTDVEEGLFGVNISLPDTDADTYADGQEVANGFDPLASQGKLESSAAVRLYSDDQEAYSLLYPGAWAVADDPQNTRGKMFTTNGEFVEVSVQENPAKLSARDWYLTKSPGIDSSRILSVSNWAKTLTGAQSLDGLTVYYTKNDKAYVINYNINILSQANYKTTFQMMYRSFKIITVSTNTNSGGNANANRNTNTLVNSNANINQNTNTNTNSNTNSNANNSNRL